MQWSIERKTAVGFGLVSLVLLIVAIITYRNGNRFVENSQWVTHTHEVMAELEATLASISEAQISARGYIITGQDHFLQPYRAATSEVHSDLDSLKVSTADNPDQQRRLAVLETAVSRTLRALEASIDVRSQQGPKAAQQPIGDSPDMDEIRAAVGEMKGAEDDLLKQRTANFQRSMSQTALTFIGLVIFEFVLLGVVFYMRRGDGRERTRAAEALRDSEERFRLMVENVKGYAIFMLDPQGRVFSWNEGAERIKGYKAEEIVGRHFSCFYPEDDKQHGKAERELEVAAAEGRVEDEGWRIRKDGSRFWASVVITAMKDSTGQIRAFSTVTRDMTERKRVEELLHESDERHRKLFDNNPFPTWMYDRETLRFLAVNSAAVRKYGYSHEEFLSMTIKDIRLPQDVPALLESVAHLVEGTENVGDWKHRRKDGSIIDVEITSFPFAFNGHPAEVVVAVDVTHRKHVEAEKQKFVESLALANQNLELRNREVEQATQLKSKFLASMSHELRTPLNAIIGFSGLLREQTAGELNDKQKRFVQHIKNGADHLLQLINDILDLSRIESGQLDFSFEDFEIGDAIPEVLSSILPLATAKKIDLAHEKNVLHVYADRRRFKQILYNLLSNAIKFTPEGGKVCVECEQDDGLIRVSVADTGIGIRPEDQELVFEEFRQIDGPSAHQGTGLGLAITRRLVEQQGGKIWLESEIRKGTRFSFTLPAGSPSSKMAEIPAPAETSVDGHRLPLILIVDDELSSRELLASYLEPAGYRVAMASSSAEAIEKVRYLRPAAITLDILMPSANGFETLLNLRDAEETAGIPIIVVSVVDQQKMGFALGAADYLVKPVDKSTLISAIRKHTQHEPNKESQILIVDDDPAAIELLDTTLRAAGYRTHTAVNGSRALEVLSSSTVSAMLIDLLMPGMDGFELIRQIKLQPSLHGIPIFVLTAKRLTTEEIALLSNETQAFFQKDGSWTQELLASVAKSIGGSNAANALTGGA
ncbi:MAG TPA: PAS domain S-box protein [Candidatus Angelobacter sp.]|nr:PAS domain S-box protein [Candidatus Angelobacter sp.]